MVPAMSARLDSILALLAGAPRGLRAEEIREALVMTEKPVKRALAYAQSVGAVFYLRVGKGAHWVAEQHRATAEAWAEQCRQESYKRDLRARAAWKRRSNARAKALTRSWPAADAWTPPGPRIPSVWHLPQAMGLA